MKRGVFALVFVFSLSFVFSSFAVDVIMDGFGATIETQFYELFWNINSGNGMGYSDVTFEGLGEQIISGGSLFHRVDYRGGRSHWGAMIENASEILERNSDVAVVEYVAHDGKSFEYHCIATYWEALHFFKHEVTVINDGPENQAWPITGDDPMLIPGGNVINLDFGDIGGVFPFQIGAKFQGELNDRDLSDDLRQEFENKDILLSSSILLLVETADEQWVIVDRGNGLRYCIKNQNGNLNVYKYPMAYWKEPIPHIVYWTDEGFGGLYSSAMDARLKFGDWMGTGDVIRLDHAMSSINVQKRKTSPALVYYVGFGKGGADEAHALAEEIKNSPDGFAVGPVGKLSSTWGAIKAPYGKEAH